MIQALELLELKWLQSVEVTVESIDKRPANTADLLGILTAEFVATRLVVRRICYINEICEAGNKEHSNCHPPAALDDPTLTPLAEPAVIEPSSSTYW